MIKEDIILSGSELPSARSFHASVTVDTCLFIHGGVGDRSHVLSSLYRYDILLKCWTLVTANSSTDVRLRPQPQDFKIKCICNEPCLSHHCALNYKDRYIVLIGGWNGKKRSADVFAYDLNENMWYQLEVSGDVPVGLSSHTGTLISDHEVLIIGREGGVHTQRRAGDAFVFNIRTCRYKAWAYRIDSRTGHTANLVQYCKEKTFRIFVYSGRKTGEQYNITGSWNQIYGKHNEINSELTNNIKSLIARSQAINTPEGRKNSRSFCIDNKFVLIYGGELWKARDCVTCEILVFDCTKCSWHKLPVEKDIPKLFGFSMNIGIDGKCYVFGGNDGKQTNNCLWNLNAIS